MATSAIPSVGDFSFILNTPNRSYYKYYQDIWDTINNNAEYLTYVKTRNPNDSWAFDNTPITRKIKLDMQYYNEHSGSSFGIMMRHIDQIINNRITWEQFYNMSLN